MNKAGNRMIGVTLLLVFGVCSFGMPARGQQDANPPAASAAKADEAAIKQAALDYIEGYYDGDGARMEKALHPELAKRIVNTDPKSGRSRLDQMSAMTLVLGTRAKAGRATPEPRQKDVTILDLYGGAASAKIVANEWIDYLHLAKFNGRWVIVNVLWELKPEKK